MTTPRLVNLDYEDLRFITARLREWDRKEIFATRWDDDPDRLAQDALSYGDFAWVAKKDEPIAAIGAAPLWPGVWSMWCFGTDRFDEIGQYLTKHAVRVMIPALKLLNYRRLECRSIEGHTKAHRWLEFLGAEVEGINREYGRNGEDFRVYVWRR